ncbi:MAG: formimidoylglutamate deiminase [Novosphingobium sp.]|uniref:formimidoylglutamate deiminase n=1 Tax=Novosphingobium sp. TaxID=1874826 RepID=UPI003C7B625F
MTQNLHFAEALLPGGWAQDVRLHLSGGTIARIESGVDAQPDDQKHTVALPGLPNLHSHAFQHGMAGLAERRGSSADSFWTWRDVMYRFVDRMTPDDMAAIAAMAYAEMLESGFTRVGEFHYLHHDPVGIPYAGAAMAEALVAAAAETGLALTLLPVFYAHAGFGGQDPSPGQRRFITGLGQFAALREASAAALRVLPDAVLGLAPHSLRAVTPDELSALAQMAGTAPVHIHAAEQLAEVEACLVWSGQRPVEWLLGHAPLGPNWCLVHATHMTADETQRLAQSGAVAGLCPITEANLGDGLFAAPDYLAAGGKFGIGSDSNVLIDAAEELRWLEYGQRLAHRSRNVFARGPDASTGAALFEGTLFGGAQALGAAMGLAEGNAADFVTLDPGHPALTGAKADQWLDQWIFAAARGAVDGVWRRGKQVVSSGRHVARDPIAANYRSTIARLLA